MQDTIQSRHLKVYPVHVCRRFLPTRTDPQIKFGGRWLQDAGFSPDLPISVEVHRQRLVITPHPKQR